MFVIVSSSGIGGRWPPPFGAAAGGAAIAAAVQATCCRVKACPLLSALCVCSCCCIGALWLVSVARLTGKECGTTWPNKQRCQCGQKFIDEAVCSWGESGAYQEIDV